MADIKRSILKTHYAHDSIRGVGLHVRQHIVWKISTTVGTDEKANYKHLITFPYSEVIVSEVKAAIGALISLLFIQCPPKKELRQHSKILLLLISIKLFTY